MGKASEDGAGRLTLLLLTLCLSSALPFCFAAFNRKQQRRPPSVDVGRRSSAVFPLYGNVYPDGLYYTELRIGDPPKPYYLDVDTGSDLTWVQCDAPCSSCFKGPHPLYRPTKDKLVPCDHPICVSLQASTAAPPGDACQCDYEVEYADHGSSLGVLVSDAFATRLVNGSLLRPRLAFGCGYDQQLYGADAASPTDGVLGLGTGGSSVVTQLREQGLTRNVMGHCLSRNGGGFLFFGDDLVPSSGVTWNTMSRRGPHASKYYSPGPANLVFGGQLVSRDLLVSRDFEVIFDSGSSYSYFSSRPYEIFLNMMMKDLSGKPLKEAAEDRTLPLCWKGAKPFRSIADARRYFKPLRLSFPLGNSLDIPPEGYLILTKHGNLCLGILNGTEVGIKDINILGDISLQDLLVVYDNEKEQIGWVSDKCDRHPNADGDGCGGRGLCMAHFASATGAFAEQCPAAAPPSRPTRVSIYLYTCCTLGRIILLIQS